MQINLKQMGIFFTDSQMLLFIYLNFTEKINFLISKLYKAKFSKILIFKYDRHRQQRIIFYLLQQNISNYQKSIPSEDPIVLGEGEYLLTPLQVHLLNKKLRHGYKLEAEDSLFRASEVHLKVHNKKKRSSGPNNVSIINLALFAIFFYFLNKLTPIDF